jgi:hypothetical protein
MSALYFGEYEKKELTGQLDILLDYSSFHIIVPVLRYDDLVPFDSPANASTPVLDF